MAKVRKIDGSVVEVPDEEIWGPPKTLEQITQERLVLAKAECRKRIFAVIDEIAQVNLAAAAAGGMLTVEQMDVYRSGLAWIHTMRATCITLSTDHTADITSDSWWVDVPAGVAELAAEF